MIVTLTGVRDAELDQRGPFLPLCIVYCVMVSLFMATSPVCKALSTATVKWQQWPTYYPSMNIPMKS